MDSAPENVPVNFFKSQPLDAAQIEKFSQDAPGVFAIIAATATGPQWVYVGRTRLSVREQLAQLLTQPPAAELAELMAAGQLRFVSSVIRDWGASAAAEAFLVQELQPQYNQPMEGDFSAYQVKIKLHGVDELRPAYHGHVATA